MRFKEISREKADDQIYMQVIGNVPSEQMAIRCVITYAPKVT